MSIDLPMPVLPPASYVPTLPPAERRRRVVLAASPCADPLELIGPMTVFQVANLVLANSDRPELGYDLEIVSSDVGDIFALPGLRITTDRPYHRLRGKVDTLVFPPMDFAVLFAGQDRFLGWVETQSRKVRRVVSVCAGAYILAAAGVLDGRRASTHWDLAHDFRRRFPEVHLDAEPIYSKDGHVYTSAGMTAGLDLAVALVEE
ncbi:MAG: AraC family transcriptional regulator, partial [Gammaproteobacteria bacterium]